MKFLKEKGFGLIEILSSVAVLGGATFAIMYGFDSLEKNKNKIDQNINLEYLLSGIIESTRANITMEKVDFRAHDDFLALTDIDEVKDSLTLCWVRSGLVPRMAGNDCKSRVGYVVTPYKLGSIEYRGLYQATVRVTHDELFPGTFKQYVFIIRGP